MYSKRKICFKFSKTWNSQISKVCPDVFSTYTLFPQSIRALNMIDWSSKNQNSSPEQSQKQRIRPGMLIFAATQNLLIRGTNGENGSNSSYMVPMMDFFSFGKPSWISSRSPITVPRFWMRGPPNSGTKNSLQNPMHFGNHISGSSVQVTSICDRIVIFFNFGQQMAWLGPTTIRNIFGIDWF